MHVGQLPSTISGNGYLPKPILRNIFINNNLDKKVEIVIEVDDIVKFSNGVMTGYWINNKKLENLLNLELDFKYLNSSNNEVTITVTKNLTKDFLGNFEEYIKNYTPEQNSGITEVKVPFFYKFIIGSADGIPSNFNHNNSSVEIVQCKTCFNNEEIRSKEGFESFDVSNILNYKDFMNSVAPFDSLASDADLNSRVLIVESGDIFENLKNVGNLTGIETLAEQDLKEPEIKVGDCVSNLRTTKNHLGHVIGFFSLDVEKFFELTNPYDKLLDNISPLKKQDIISDLLANDNFIKSMKIERIRLSEVAKLRPGRYEPVFDSEVPPLKIASLSSKDGTTTLESIEKIEEISLEESDKRYLHFSFTDAAISETNTGIYKYRLIISSDTSSFIKKKFQNDVNELINNLSTIKIYHETSTSFGYNSVVERFSTDSVGYFVNNRELLRSAIVGILVKLADYAKSTNEEDITDTITNEVDSAMNKLNPRKTKPEYMHKFINDIDSKIATVSLVTGLTSARKSDEDKGGTNLNSKILDQYSYTFTNEVEATDNSGLEYFDKISSRMIRVTRGEYDSRIKDEKAKYNAGNSQTSDTFWDTSTGHTFLAPIKYRDNKGDEVKINKLSSPTFQNLKEIIKNRGLFENLPLLKVAKEIKQSGQTVTDLTSYLEGVSISKGVSFENGTAIQMDASGKRLTPENATKTNKEQNLSRLGIYKLKNEIQVTTRSPFNLGVSNGTLKDLNGFVKDLPDNFSFRSIPQHFRYQIVRDDRIVLDPPSNFRKCENSFSQGLGSLFYYLTYGQIRMVEYLSGKSGVKSEIWKPLTSDKLLSFSSSPLLCKIVDYTNDVIGFATATESRVNNHYFLLTPEGNLSATETTEINLGDAKDVTATVNEDGTISIIYDADDDKISSAERTNLSAINLLRNIDRKINPLINSFDALTRSINNFPNRQPFIGQANVLYDTVRNSVPDALVCQSDAKTLKDEMSPLLEKARTFTHPNQSILTNTVDDFINQFNQKFFKIQGKAAIIDGYQTDVNSTLDAVASLQSQAAQAIQDEIAAAQAAAEAAAERERQRQAAAQLAAQQAEDLAAQAETFESRSSANQNRGTAEEPIVYREETTTATAGARSSASGAGSAAVSGPNAPTPGQQTQSSSPPPAQAPSRSSTPSPAPPGSSGSSSSSTPAQSPSRNSTPAPPPSSSGVPSGASSPPAGNRRSYGGPSRGFA